MPRVNVTTTTDLDARRAVSPQVAEAAEVEASQRRELPNEIEAPARTEVAPSDERRLPTEAAPASNETFHAESAPAPAGSASRPASSATQPQRIAERVEAAREQPSGRHFAQAAGLAGTNGQSFAQAAGLAGTTPQGIGVGDVAPVRQGEVPVLDMSQAASSGVESSRDGTIDPLVKSMVNEQLGATSIAPAQAQPAPSMPSVAAEETVNSDVRQADDIAKRVADAAASPTPSTSAAVGSDRPASVWNRSFGWAPKGQSSGPRFRQASTKRSSTIVEKVMKRMKNAFSHSGVGYHVYGKMLALVTLDFREVGVGIQEIVDAANQNSEMLDRLLAPYLDGGSVAGMSANEIANIVNSNEVYVATFKSPDNRGQDIQRRRLRVLTNERRGIYLHPVMAAMYTADFDGDDMAVSFDPAVVEYAKDPMDYMVGIDNEQSLNTDFLPVAKIVDLENMDARKYVRTVMLSRFANIDADRLVDLIMELGDTAHNGKPQAEAWSNVFREARKIADESNPGNKAGSDSMMSRLCQAVYSGMYEVKRQVAYSSAGVDIVSMQDLPTPRSYSDHAIYRVLDGIVSGEVPNNFQDLKLAMTGFLGNVSGKNAPFRFTADVGKMLKMDSRLQVGSGNFEVDPDNEEQMKMFFESTMKYAESYRMAREIKKAGRSQYYTQLMRDLVIKDVGFPDRDSHGRPYGSYQEFLDAFAESYSRHSAIINEANLVWLTDMGIASDSNRSVVSSLDYNAATLGDIADPMISVYGTYSVGRMFGNLSTSGIMGDTNQDTIWSGNPNKTTRSVRPVEREYDAFGDAEFWVTGKYLGYSLRQFKTENRLIRGGSDAVSIEDVYEGGNLKKRGIRNTLVSSLGDASDVDVEFMMLLAIADKRTSTASKFNEKNYGMERTRRDGTKYVDYSDTTVQMQADLLAELDRLDTDGTVNGRADQMLWIDDVVQTLIESGPDMFMHFGMDNTAGFLQSKWARKMVEHRNDPEILGGIRTAMVFDYRMERIQSILSDMTDPSDDVYQWMDEVSNLQLAKDELSSASEVWRGIMSEFVAEVSDGQESVFQQMRKNASMAVNRRLLQRSVDGGRLYNWDIEYDARDFWANPGEHTTLRSVIEDLDMDRQTKWNVIADVVRYWENDAYLKSYEVGYQMEIGNDTSYDLVSGATQSALGTHRDFEKSFNRWADLSQQKLQEEVDIAASRWNTPQKRGSLMTTLQRLDSRPWETIAVNDLMYADSIMAAKDKNYAQTEKGSQHPWTNAVYSALSNQRNGGFMNDVTRTDDRMVGIQSTDSLGIQDVIHILSDPTARLSLYNEYGEKILLTRDLLLEDALGRPLGTDVESDIWEFLQKNPRIASAIRMHNACVIADSDAKGYVGATLSIDETIQQATTAASNPIDHVKYLMRDHPVYAGIISLVSPAIPGRSSVTRMERQRVSQIENYLSFRLCQEAQSGVTPVDAAESIMEDLGITQDALQKAMQSKYDVYLSMRGLPTVQDAGESVRDADGIYDEVQRALVRYVNEIRQNVDLTKPIPMVSAGKTIMRFRNANNFLSNMYNTPVTIDGITYRNAEAAFQAQKSADPSVRAQFARLSGYDARELGNKIQIRDDWDSIKEGVMRLVIQAKFSNPEMQRRLEETGDAELVEGNTWGDVTWGVSNGRGQNLLGKILMEQRGIQPRMTPGARRPYRLGVDAMSCASFWDVVQELGGAKTAVSTGIEGYETYQFAEWASHISARDRYADLEAVPDGDVDARWDGMWTNAGIPLQVDENGTITNYDAIMQAKRERNLDEVVTMVPDGYTVKDRSTDSFGTQVASLFAYMVSKRSNGAEAFNLKAKKSGIDKEGTYGYDSVTKMSGKYRMVQEDGRHGRLSPANIESTQEHLRDIAQQDGIDAAKEELARTMMNEDMRLGYKDLTLSNYMSIADLMLIEGEDGELYLRSLEMLFSAIKHRLGAKVDEMTDEQIREAADQIVHDNTQTGVGIAEMVSPMDALMGIRPNRKSNSTNGIRPTSSVFERNYNLLANITESALTKYAVEPISQEEARSLTEKYSNVKGVSDVLSGSTVARNYSIVGYAAAQDGGREIKWTVGPSNAIVIGSGSISDAEVEEMFDRAYDLGMTVIVSVENRNKIPKRYILDAMPCSDFGSVIVPCFDMRLNGSESAPYNGGRFATFQAPYSRYVTSVEDSVNEFELGDAQARPTRDLIDRLHVTDTGSVQVRAEDMFPNVFRNPRYRHSSFAITLASGDEINSLIARGVRCTIDYGIVEGGRGFDQRVHDVNAAIRRYQDRWSEADEDGIIRGGMMECRPGDIVGWAECLITDQFTGEESIVLSPIIPFQLHGPTKNVPEVFTVEQLGYANDDNTLFAVDWSNTSSLENGFAKYFDSSGGANKGMMSFADAIDGQRLLRDGTPIDVYIAKASTDSRKIGTDRRIKTMISLMALARMHGYNFAEVDGAFPDNPQLRERMLSGRVPASEWRDMLNGRDIMFIDGDRKLNAFLNYECRKVLDNGGNPYDYLANTYTDANGDTQNTHVMWEFEAMFDQGLNYEDSLLHFLHTMDTKFCPNGIDDMGDYNFRLYRDGSGSAEGYDNGVLQMQVPHQRSDGSMAYIWDNVYIGMSFFGEDYSGFSRPNVDGASNFLDAMNTMSYYGKQLDETSARFRAMWATADIGRMPRDGGALGKA
jgi:ribA/ribD-fused uncharacterized protein